MIFKRKEMASDSSFSTFFHTASSRDKKRVFQKVMKNANEMQREIIKASNQQVAAK